MVNFLGKGFIVFDFVLDMERERIKLLEKKAEEGSPVEFMAKFFRGKMFAGNILFAFAEEIEGHYLLRKSLSGDGTNSNIFGISHEVVEAEERLHNEVKITAEVYSKERCEGKCELVDSTRYAPDSLPHGGK